MAGTAVGLVRRAHQIAAHPFAVQVHSSTLNHWLLNLAQPNLVNTADGKALWATRAQNAGEGTVFAGTAWIVSGEAYKRIKAHRF